MRNIIFAAFLAMVFLMCPPTFGNSDKPWNFIVILLDDAGWKDLGFTGNKFIETPNMDGLARDGMQFPTAYSTHPFCAPSRQSMISGQWPARTAWMQRSETDRPDAPCAAPPYVPQGAHAWTQRRPGFTSLAEALKSAGYATAHIGKWHFGEIGGEVTPESEGFDVNFGGGQRVGAVKNFFSPYEGLPGNVESRPGEYLTDRLTDETIRFVRENKDRPFYVQLWHYAPHTPIQAPVDIVRKYRKKRMLLGDDTLNPTYAAMIDCVDQGIGRIMETLDRFGLSKNTVIVLASDNGGVESLGSIPVTSMAPLRGYKGLIYEGGVREPMLVCWPGHVRPGSTSDLPVSLIDFYPTILDIANVPLPENQPVDGMSLVPLLEKGKQAELSGRPLFWYNVTSGAEPDGTIFVPAAAVRKGAWRLVKNFGWPLELYHLESDPSESVNRASQEPERARMLAALLDEWLVETGVVTPTANPFYDSGYVIPRQISNRDIPRQAQAVRFWNLGSRDSRWNAARMVKTERLDNAMRMHADGIYPEIQTKDVAGLPAGLYAVQIELRVPTSGRIRFAWQAGNNSGVVEFFPQRGGKWNTLTGLFEAKEPLESLQFAAPTHLEYTGHYDPDTQPDYIEVRSIKLIPLKQDILMNLEGSEPSTSFRKQDPAIESAGCR